MRTFDREEKVVSHEYPLSGGLSLRINTFKDYRFKEMSRTIPIIIRENETCYGILLGKVWRRRLVQNPLSRGSEKLLREADLKSATDEVIQGMVNDLNVLIESGVRLEELTR